MFLIPLKEEKLIFNVVFFICLYDKNQIYILRTKKNLGPLSRMPAI